MLVLYFIHVVSRDRVKLVIYKNGVLSFSFVAFIVVSAVLLKLPRIFSNGAHISKSGNNPELNSLFKLLALKVIWGQSLRHLLTLCGSLLRE